jgi:hypothetical protein
MNFSGKNIELGLLMLTVIVIAIWQILFIVQLPDGDTDAYAHFIIARDLVRNGNDLGLHWVWLPLFHYIGAFFVLIGSEMQSIRFLNVLIWNSIPFILYFNLKKKEPETIIPVFAALLTVLFPIGVLMGTTAQPEPLFALLILLFVVTLEDGKFLTSAFILSIACMLRYEAWAVLLGLGLYMFIKVIKEGTLKISFIGKSYKIYTVLLFPIITISIWSVLRYKTDGQWLSFLHGTQKFASDALGQTNSIDGGLWNFIADLFFYPFWVPFIFSGIMPFLAIIGFRKFYPKNKVFFVTSISILVFISISWIMKANLGLNRHFASVIPFYSALTAYGLSYLYEHLKKVSVFKSGKSVPVIASLIILVYSVMWLYIWRDNNEASFKERNATVSFLKRVYESESGKGIMILSNEPVIEVLSKIDYKIYNHYWMEANQDTKNYILELKKSSPNVYIIANSRLEPFLNKLGVVIFESSPDQRNPDRIIILKI